MRSHKALTRRDDERGVVIPLVALALVALLIMTAIAVDGGNARQNKREAQAAADAGALGGAKSLDSGASNPQPPGCNNDQNCVAAYYTFLSAGLNLPTNFSTILLGSRVSNGSQCNTGTGETCYSYSYQGKTVSVTVPYAFHGQTASTRWTHVRACWNSPNAFGGVANLSLFNVCGSATAENTGVSGGGGVVPPQVGDCSGEDNFTDSNDNPTLIGPTPVKAGSNIGAHFHSHEGSSALDPNSIIFKGPLLNADGTVTPDAVIPYNKDGTHGYKLSKIPPIDANGNWLPYTGTNGQDVDIQYKIPNAPPLVKYDTDGVTRIVYNASLYAKDTDQDHGANAPDCGNASWKFTFDGKGVTGSCGENSFFQGTPPYFPSTGHATPGASVGSNYVDESPIQAHNSPYPDATGTDVGINFTIDGPGFSVDDGTGTNTLVPMQIMPATVPGDPTTGYTLTNSAPNYTTQILWKLPGPADTRWQNGKRYTISLKAYDTDNNKPGNDCGVASWSFIISGATNGTIHLVE